MVKAKSYGQQKATNENIKSTVLPTAEERAASYHLESLNNGYDIGKRMRSSI